MRYFIWDTTKKSNDENVERPKKSNDEKIEGRKSNNTLKYTKSRMDEKVESSLFLTYFRQKGLFLN